MTDTSGHIHGQTELPVCNSCAQGSQTPGGDITASSVRTECSTSAGRGRILVQSPKPTAWPAGCGCCCSFGFLIPFFFLSFFFFISKMCLFVCLSEEQQKDKSLGSAPKQLQQREQGQAEARSLRLHRCLPHMVSHMSHLPLPSAHKQPAE